VALDQPGGGDGSRVDHRVERAVGSLVENDGVEGVAGRLHAHAGQHAFEAVIFQREAVHERLGNTLNRERHLAVADRVGLAVHRHQCDPERAGIDLGQLRDVIRERTPVFMLVLRVKIFQACGDGRVTVLSAVNIRDDLA
jgi:hypothetical protein